MWGTWVAQSVKACDSWFRLGSWSHGWRIQAPHRAPRWQCRACLGFSLSLSLPLPPPLSLSLKVNKLKKIFFKEAMIRLCQKVHKNCWEHVRTGASLNRDHVNKMHLHYQWVHTDGQYKKKNIKENANEYILNKGRENHHFPAITLALMATRCKRSLMNRLYIHGLKIYFTDFLSIPYIFYEQQREDE